MFYEFKHVRYHVASRVLLYNVFYFIFVIYLKDSGVRNTENVLKIYKYIAITLGVHYKSERVTRRNTQYVKCVCVIVQ